jgi:hypothetical protein
VKAVLFGFETVHSIVIYYRIPSAGFSEEKRGVSMPTKVRGVSHPVGELEVPAHCEVA